MSKVLLLFSTLILSCMAVGTSNYPDNALFWLGSSSFLFQCIRGVMVLFLAGFLVTAPPRHLIVRSAALLASLVVALWAVLATLSFKMSVVDMFAFLAGSLTLCVAALEGAGARSTPVTHWSAR